MKTKINYVEQFNSLRKSAENELKNFLKNCPNNEYSFLTDEDYENLSDTIFELDVPIVNVINKFDDRICNIYVDSVALSNGNLLISGFEPLFLDDVDVRVYYVEDLINMDIVSIIDKIG